MSINQPIQIFIVFMEIAIIILVSIIYTWFYSRTRKLNITNFEMMHILKRNLLFCFWADAVLVLADPFSDCGSYKYMLLLLFGITENIDLFIHKIPTEILLLELLLSISQISKPVNIPNFAASLLFSSLWFLAKRKIRIGTNDILLILILTVMLPGYYGTILFNSVIMIIWGAVGIIIQKAFNKGPETQIPLAPLIITAFTLVKQLL